MYEYSYTKISTRCGRIKAHPAPRHATEVHITDDVPRALRDSPLHLLRRALQRYTAHWQSAISELTPPQYAVLLTVREEPGVDQSRLSALTRIDVATLTPLLVRLERRGLVARTTDPDNRRRKVPVLTEDGNKLLDRLSPLSDAVDHSALADVSPSELETVKRVLFRMATAPPAAHRD